MRLKISACLVLFALPLVAADSELKDAAGKTVIKYVVEAPESVPAANTADPAKQLGLILCFPEHDRPVGDEILPVRAALERLGIRDHFVLLAGGPQAQKFGNADLIPIATLIDWAKKTYAINPRRVYMYGKGEGGKISGQFASAHPDVVTAAVTYSWGWWLMPSETTEAIDPAKNTPEFYMVLGLRDLSYHLTTVRDTFARVDAKGHHVIYREFDDLAGRTYHPASNGDAMAWISRLRNKMLPLSPAEQNILARYSSASSVPAPGADGTFAELALVGGAPAGAVVRTLLASKDARVREVAAATCADAVFDEPTMAALGKLSGDPEAKVRREAMHALALQANWRSGAAQQALIAVATGSQPSTQTDRVAAVDGLVYATRYQIKGFRQDPPMFRALISLLKDPNDEVKTMAVNALAPIRDGSFRGDLDRKERPAPADGWDGWLKNITEQSAGYRQDFEVCHQTSVSGSSGASEALGQFCQGAASLFGAPGNPAKAFPQILKAAELGLVEAQSAVAMLYAVGKGVEQNVPEAAKWWTRAADQGNVFAAARASAAYRGGPGVGGDNVKSEKYRIYAAEHTVNPDR